MRAKRVGKLICMHLILFVAIGSVVGLVMVVSSWVSWINRELAPVWASLTVSQYAHIQAGEKVPFPDDTIYTRSVPMEIWTEGVNSMWLADYTRLIVPFMAYENIVYIPYYPSAVLFIPEDGPRSFHVGGTTHMMQDIITINERYILDPRWEDQREALFTLTHELVHVQGGAFVPGAGREPEEFEANTSAAATEVLAAICNYGDQLACKAFWLEVEEFARIRLRLQLLDLGLPDSVYQFIADALWRDEAEELAARKALRYWANNQEEMWYIIRAYASRPFFLFVEGLQGAELNTGNHGSFMDNGAAIILGMPYDDSLDLTPGWIRGLIILMSK